MNAAGSHDSLPVIYPDRWEKRFVIEARRASEAVRLYGSIGYEVRLVRIDSPVEGAQCNVCFDAEEMVEVWTRPSRKDSKDG